MTVPEYDGAPAAGRLVVLVGPSGVGKGTVIRAARALLPTLWVSLSATTRAPRPGEAEGVAYQFVTPAEFERMVADGELLEHHAHFSASYGTPREPVETRLAAGVPSALEIDLHGARQVREALGEKAYLVFLAPPSAAELERRLTARATEDAGALAARLDRAREELAAMGEFDAVIVNDDVAKAARELVSLWG